MHPESQYVGSPSAITPPPLREATTSMGQGEKAKKKARLMLELEEIKIKRRLMELENEIDE